MHSQLRILTADTLITDYILDADKLPELVKQYNENGYLKPDSKMQITKAQYDEFKCAAGGNYESKSPGGSSFNTSVTLRRALGDGVAVKFMGVLGEDEDSKNIASALNEAGIKLLPLSSNHGQFAQPPEAATSFVIMSKDRRRAVASYAGRNKEYLVPDMVTEERVKACNVVFLQGSLWQKLDETFPVVGGHAEEPKLGFADKMLRYRWSQGKELWFALPTQSNYGTIKRGHNEKAAHFRHVMAEANVVLGNSEELARAFTTDDEYKAIQDIIAKNKITPQEFTETKENPNPVVRLQEQGKLTEAEIALYNFQNKSVQARTAFGRMQEVFAREPLLIASNDPGRHGGSWKGNNKQLAFITCGKQGSVVITKDDIKSFAAQDIPEAEIKNTVGAGDTAFAGFLTGYVAGQPNEISANIASEFASAKLRHNGATLPDPKSVITEKFPHLSRVIFSGQNSAQVRTIG